MDLTITGKGQFTLNKVLLQHLGVRPGEKISVTKTPEGLSVRAARRGLSIDEVLKGLDKIVQSRALPSSIDDINQAIAEGYAEAGMRGLK